MEFSPKKLLIVVVVVASFSIFSLFGFVDQKSKQLSSISCDPDNRRRGKRLLRILTGFLKLSLAYNELTQIIMEKRIFCEFT